MENVFLYTYQQIKSKVVE